MAIVSYAHIDCESGSEPLIAGTRIKVRMIAIDQLVHGWSAQEIQEHHPDLTLGQIHSALAFYHDHKPAIDQEIAERRNRAEALRAHLNETPGRCKLRARGLRP